MFEAGAWLAGVTRMSPEIAMFQANRRVSPRLAGALAVALLLGGVARAADSDQPPASVSTAAPVMATAARLDSRGDLTRLSFDLSAPVAATAHVLADPDRVVIDLPEINFQIDPAIGRPAVAERTPPARARGRGHGRAAPVVGAPSAPLAGVVGSYRFGLFAPGRSRVVIDLARADRASFLAAARAETHAPQEAPADAGALAARPAGDRPVIVLDAGHGGVDDGAHGPGSTLEKDVVLDFTRELAARIEKLGRY